MADNWEIPQPNSSRPIDRRQYDPKLNALFDKIEALQRKIEIIDDLNFRVRDLEKDHKNTSKDVDEHDAVIKAIQVFASETKLMHASFEKHMTSQNNLNEKLSASIQKNTDFQNRLIMIGGGAFLLWQMFGSKLFVAASELIK